MAESENCTSTVYVVGLRGQEEPVTGNLPAQDTIWRDYVDVGSCLIEHGHGVDLPTEMCYFQLAPLWAHS